MATELVLMADVKDLGAEGDVVKVADGYARNYLLPQNLGGPVTPATRRRLEKMRKERDVLQKTALEAAKREAAKLAGASCTIAVKTGDDDKMYGSVTAANVVDALKAQGFEVDRHALVLEHPLKELGVFDIAVRLHPEVEASVKVWIVEE